MNILAIRFARLGDVILLLHALSKLKASVPDCRLTFLTGHRCAPVAELCPSIDEVISVDRLAMRDGPVLGALSAMARLVRDVRGRKFDLVIDFHGFRETNLLTWFSGAPRRLGLKRFDQSFLPFCFNLPPVVEDKALHVARMFDSVVERMGWRATPTGPLLVVPEDATGWSRTHIPPEARGRLLVLYVDAPAPERIWPPERFAALGDEMVERFGATVVVIAGPSSAGLVQAVVAASRQREQFHAFSGVSIPQLAALIESGRVFVSNDTGPMHLGPALGIPTVGLFSVGLPEHFRPSGRGDYFLRGNPIDTILVKDVTSVTEQIWPIEVDRGLQR